MAEISANEGVRFVVDLENQQVTTPAWQWVYLRYRPLSQGQPVKRFG